MLRPDNAYIACVLAQQDALRKRAGREAQLMWANGIRSIIAFGVSLLFVPHWLGVALFWIAVFSSVAAWHHFMEYNIARTQSAIF